jgi:uncharacterized protein (UPF0332 family)
MNKTKPQRIDPKQVKQFLADAHKKASTARKNLPIDAEAAYQIAYEAMLKASLALMLSHGERPRVQLGHHIAIIEFSEKHLASAPAGIFAQFDRMRRKRNNAFYDLALISDTEAEEAVKVSEEYLKLVSADLAVRLPVP